MKATSVKKDFMEAWGLVSRCVNSRSNNAVLQYVKLKITTGMIVLTGTDRETTVVTRVLASSDSEWQVLLPAQYTSEILKVSSSDNIEIEVQQSGDNKQVYLIAGDAKYKIGWMEPKEYPSEPEFDELTTITVSGRQLRSQIHFAAIAIDTESTRYALGGVRLELDKSNLDAIATDGRRLVVNHGQCTVVSGKIESNAIIPSRTLGPLQAMLHDDEVKLKFSTNLLFVDTGTTQVYCSLVEGRFPEWKKVIPDYSRFNRIETIAGPLNAAIRQANLACDRETSGVEFKISDNNIVMQAKSDQKGEAQTSLPVLYEGEAITAMYDGKFFNEFLRMIEPDAAVEFFVDNGQTAGVVTAYDRALEFIIMPMAIDR